MTRSRVRTSLAALAAATVLVSAGCGVKEADGGGQAVSGPEITTGPGPVEPGTLEGTGGVVYLQQAAEATSELESMRMAMTMEMTGMPMFGDVTMTVEGAFDDGGRKAHMQMDMTDMFDAIGSLGSEGDVPEGAGLIEMVVDGDTTYIKSPMFDAVSGVDPDKPWLSISTEDVSDSQTFSQGTNDPEQFLDFLRNNGSEVTEVGTEEVRGVTTTHLRTVLDPEKMIENAAPEEADELEASLEGLGAEGIVEIPVDVWVDEDGIVRKMVMEMDLSGIEEDGISMDGASVTMTMEMYDLGEPVDIQVPDPSEVQEMDASLLGD